MCGIVGYVGKKGNALTFLIDSLKNLEYRGYDSAGIAYVSENKIDIKKEKGKIAILEEAINQNIFSNLGIGHTRWATHGVPNQINSHPHQVGRITIVHNGIIENYMELKKELSTIGYTFKSQTDTEVACALLDNIYNETNDMVKTIEQFKQKAKGAYALGIICNDHLDHLYAIKKDSPLIIGIGKGSNYIASDVPAILKYTNQYIILEDGEFAQINSDDIIIYSKENKLVKKEIKTFSGSVNDIEKNGYDHFMLKEINEQPEVIKNTISSFLENNDMTTLIKNMPDFSKYNKIDIVACGSAYHTGLIGKTLIEEYAHIPVSVEIASEYRYKTLFLTPTTLVIVISQSGETADTRAALEVAKAAGSDTLGIINVKESTIARLADIVLYTSAGSEIAVATTKAYSAQIAILSLIALTMSYKTLSKEEIETILTDLKRLPVEMQKLLDDNKTYQILAEKIYDEDDTFFIGRDIDYALCMEGSLKLKEISYIHSEAYAAGELKHGTISLIEEGTPVIAIVTEEHIAEKTISNIKEVKARGAYVILLTTEKLDTEGDFYDEKIVIPNIHKLYSSLLTVIPLQLLAYEVAKLRHCDIDKPKNLAKSVTVE